jgi:predicted RNA binding protein YcfA (HicA-like mRNA interferase family)
VNGAEFVRKVRHLAKERGVECSWDPRRGKGSHGRFLFGKSFTTVKHGEISPALLASMLKQLGLTKDDLS